IALDRKNIGGIRALWLGLAQLVAAGVPMNLTSLWADYQLVDDPRTGRKQNPALTVNGANYGRPAVAAAPANAPNGATGKDHHESHQEDHQEDQYGDRHQGLMLIQD